MSDVVLPANAAGPAGTACLTDVFAGILVGGRGQRLGGVDKARLPLPAAAGGGGESGESGAAPRTTLERLVHCLQDHVVTVLLAGRVTQSYPEVACRMVQDAAVDAGPLAGLVALLRAAPVPWCWLLACDLPRLDPSLVHRLAQARRAATPIVVLETAHGLEPTAALYHRSILPEAEASLQRGELSLRRLIDRLPHTRLALSAASADSLFNVNQPHDLHVLRGCMSGA